MDFEDNTESKLTKGRTNEKASIRLHLGNGGYYLGDPDDKDYTPYISYDERYKTEPKVTHNDVTKLTNEQLEEIFGIKIMLFAFLRRRILLFFHDLCGALQHLSNW